MSTTDKPPIDPATVQRCIELLKGTGCYDKQWKRLSHMDEPDLVETWTYTQHPIDLLAGLLKTERTEAEKLVDAWLGGNMDEDDQDYVRLAQFILDKQKRDNPAEILRNWATDFAEEHGYTVNHESFDAAAAHAATPIGEPEPQTEYVFGPWVKWYGGECPVPGDWMVETLITGETVGDYDDGICRAESYDGSSQAQHGYHVTHYRVRFTVGQWYDWAGGDECPVGKDVKGVVRFNTGKENASGEQPLSLWAWGHNRCARNNFDIVAFKITSTGETA